MSSPWSWYCVRLNFRGHFSAQAIHSVVRTVQKHMESEVGKIRGDVLEALQKISETRDDIAQTKQELRSEITEIRSIVEAGNKR